MVTRFRQRETKVISNRPARSMVIAAVLGATAVLAVGVVPANAVARQYSVFASESSDYARTTDVTGGCSSVSARHYYDPVWSGTNYWTSWYYGGDVAQTPRTAELIKGQHSGY